MVILAATGSPCLRFPGQLLRRRRPRGQPGVLAGRSGFPVRSTSRTALRRCPRRCPPATTLSSSLPPLELSRGVDLPGVVLDEASKPVADAEVEAIHGQAILTRTDPHGRFVLSAVDPLQELKLEARRGDASSGRTAILRAGNIAASPLSLAIHRSAVSRLAGRVVDRSGRPVGGASVRIWRQIRQEGQSFLREPVAANDGSIVLRTGADGRFHTTRPLPPGDEYVVDAERGDDSPPGRRP